MKTKIKKTAAAFLFALLCLTVFPASVSAADSAERTASVAIPVSVNLSGEVPSPAETYTVTMQAAEEGTPMPCLGGGDENENKKDSGSVSGSHLYAARYILLHRYTAGGQSCTRTL